MRRFLRHRLPVLAALLFLVGHAGAGLGDKGGIAAANRAPVAPWHTKTITLVGPDSSETAAPNPFTDYRLEVTFSHPSVQYVVRGFYAADGNAAESGASAGNVWQARFAPDRTGEWAWAAALRRGPDVAIDDDPTAGSAVEIEDAQGSFRVVEKVPEPGADPADFRTRGRIVADGGYLRFGPSGARWLKGGANSPENLLAYADFDGTRRLPGEAAEHEARAGGGLHEYEAHRPDWREGDPSWRGGRGKGLVGAINYLAESGMNAAYFLTLNIGGDGRDVWPYAAPDDFSRFDCSKLDQWEIVFEHMQRRGILLHVVLQETENERLLDGGDTGRLRKLYYRELIARFAHHPALIWNLGEENGPSWFSPDGQTPEQQRAMASYLERRDPYGHPIVVHTHATRKDKKRVLRALLGHPSLDGLSLQVWKPGHVHREVIRWREESRRSGREWLIAMDEVGLWHSGVVPDAVDPDHDALRRKVLWGSLLAGAAGVEWYFGARYPHNDLTSEDWRQRASIWRQTKHALEFFQRHLPYWEMEPSDRLVADGEQMCFAKRGTVYAVYVPGSERDRPGDSAARLDLEGSTDRFSVRWFDPKNGGELRPGTVAAVRGPGKVELGAPPGERRSDWVALVSREPSP